MVGSGGPAVRRRPRLCEKGSSTLGQCVCASIALLSYIDCLNSRAWPELDHFVDADVSYNGQPIGLTNYREMLEANVRDIPDLHFDVELLVCEPPQVAPRLRFDCTPQGDFLGLGIDGRRVSFAENVFYRFAGQKIAEVSSVIDKAAIEAQLE
jgi:predicted ester cyclase